MYHVYLLHSDKKTYIGMTDDPLHRLRQHNREIAGGARATAGQKWKHVCVLSGFPTRRSALQFEWMWKYCGRRARARTVETKMETFVQIWKRDCSSSTSIHFSQFSTPFFLSFSGPWTDKLKKIECIQSLKLCRRAANFQISDYDSFQLFPFPAISKMSSPVSNDVSNVVVESAPAAEVKKAPRKPKTAAAAVAVEEKPKEEKPTKKTVRKAKADDAEAPAAAPAPAAAEEKPKKEKKAKKAAAEPAAAAAEDEPVIALPGSTVALASAAGAGAGAGAPAKRSDAVVSEAETTDAEAAPKEKKPRKPRAKKAAAAAPAALAELDTATLDSLDMAGKVALLKDHVLTLTQQVAALTARLESGAAAGSDDESTGKKQRKKREPKEKAVCPAAADGVIRFHTTLKNDYKPLSNSFKADITIDGVVYPTVEHYYQCAKFLTTDAEYAEKIRNTANAALVKNMGRTKIGRAHV